MASSPSRWPALPCPPPPPSPPPAEAPTKCRPSRIAGHHAAQSADAAEQVGFSYEPRPCRTRLLQGRQAAEKHKAGPSRRPRPRPRRRPRKAREAKEAAQARASRSSERSTLSTPRSPPPPATPPRSISFLKAQLGKAYVLGSTGPSSYDCSGLTQAAFKQVGVDLPRVSQDQSTVGTQVAWTTSRSATSCTGAARAAPTTSVSTSVTATSSAPRTPAPASSSAR